MENVREEKADGKGVGGSNYPFDYFSSGLVTFRIISSGSNLK